MAEAKTEVIDLSDDEKETPHKKHNNEKDDELNKKMAKLSIDEESIIIDIVTWNTNHGSDGNTRGFASVRNHIIEHFRSEYPNYFYCIQEAASTAPFKNYSFQWQKNSIKEAAIANDATIIKKCIKPPEDHADCTFNKDKRRYYGVQFFIGDQYQFLLISYHAPSKETDKIDVMKKFFIKMLDVAETHQMTVIIGGDFNYDVKEWKSEIEDMGGTRIKVADEYEVGKLREGKEVIDTFAVVYPPDGVTYTRCELMGKPRPVSLHNIVDNVKELVSTDNTLKNLKDTEIEDLYMKMDHDPVAITVKLKTPKTDPK